MNRVPLPIDAVLPRLISALWENSCTVLRAPTGSGKTTRVPPALLDAGFAQSGAILMLEPRRIAARAAARRIADERSGQVGGEIGYHVRFDRKVGPGTRIRIDDHQCRRPWSIRRCFVEEQNTQTRNKTGDAFTRAFAVDASPIFAGPNEPPSAEAANVGLAYGIGWGCSLIHASSGVFKEGIGDGAQNYMICLEKRQTRMILLTNSDNDELAFRSLLETIPGNTVMPWE